MKLHVGDTIVVITGKDKGKTGRVLRVHPEDARVVVSDINMRTRFTKKTPQAPGRQVRFEASIAAGNVMLLDPKLKKPTRIGFRIVSGKKERFAKLSGEALASGKKLQKLSEEGAKESKEAKESPSSAKASEGKKEKKETKNDASSLKK